jgi:hypothetical protein
VELVPAGHLAQLVAKGVVIHAHAAARCVLVPTRLALDGAIVKDARGQSVNDLVRRADGLGKKTHDDQDARQAQANAQQQNERQQ